MSKLTFIDQIAQGGEQGWADVPRRTRMTLNVNVICALLISGAIWYFLIWGATEGWKYVGRR